MQQRIEIYSSGGMLSKKHRQMIKDQLGDRVEALIDSPEQPIINNSNIPIAYSQKMVVNDGHSDMFISLTNPLDLALFKKSYLRFIEKQRIVDVDQQALKDIIEVGPESLVITPSIIHQAACTLRYFGACLHYLNADDRPLEFISMIVNKDLVHIQYRIG